MIQKSDPVEGTRLSQDIIQMIVKNSDKKRFQISDDLLKIRAIQGHSTSAINRSFTAYIPPEFLYHGTAQRFIESIKTQGLIAKERHYVHLTEHINTAHSVGQRYGHPVILKIHALKMHHDGFIFYKTENDVWLTTHVTTQYME